MICSVPGRRTVREQRQAVFAGTPMVGQRAQARAYAEHRVGRHLWNGISTVRVNCGTAIVGDPTQVADELLGYWRLGVDEFILSGYPHVEECRRVAADVLPLLLRVEIGTSRPITIPTSADPAECQPTCRLNGINRMAVSNKKLLRSTAFSAGSRRLVLVVCRRPRPRSARGAASMSRPTVSGSSLRDLLRRTFRLADPCRRHRAGVQSGLGRRLAPGRSRSGRLPRGSRSGSFRPTWSWSADRF